MLILRPVLTLFFIMIGGAALGDELAIPATLVIDLINLAALYNDQGRYAEAEPLYERALAILEKTLGPEHPNLASTLENYSALLREVGRDAEAADMEARAEAIRAKRAEENP